MSATQPAYKIPRFFGDLQDVQIGTLADGHLPQWDATAGRWVNRTADAAGLVDKASAQTIAGAKTWTGAQSITPTTVGATGLTLDLPATAANTGGVGLYITYASADNGGNTPAIRVFSRINPNNQNVFNVTRDGAVACVGTVSIAPVGTAATAGLPRVSLNAGNNGGLLLASGMSVLWANDASNANQTKDVGLARNAAGQLRVTNGSTGNGSLLAGGLSVPGSGSNSEQFGASASAAGAQATAVGSFANASGNDSSVSIGFNSQATAGKATAIGGYTSATGNASVCIGWGAAATGTAGIVVGGGSVTTGILLGTNSTVSGNGAIGVGVFNELTHQGSIGIGRSLTSAATGDILLGFGYGNIYQPIQLKIVGSTTAGKVTLAETRHSLADTTFATFKARSVYNVFDATTAREAWRAESDGSRGYQIQSAHATAPADSMLPNSSMVLWADSIAAQPAIAFKYKDGSGTVHNYAIGKPIAGSLNGASTAYVVPVTIGGTTVYLFGRDGYIGV